VELALLFSAWWNDSKATDWTDTRIWTVTGTNVCTVHGLNTAIFAEC